MREITCYCGKSKKRFISNRINVFHNDCCEEAGYNHLGELETTQNKDATQNDLSNTQNDLSNTQGPDYSNMDRPSLLKLAKSKGLKVTSVSTKAKLITALRETDNDSAI